MYRPHDAPAGWNVKPCRPPVIYAFEGPKRLGVPLDRLAAALGRPAGDHWSDEVGSGFTGVEHPGPDVGGSDSGGGTDSGGGGDPGGDPGGGGDSGGGSSSEQ